MVTAQNPTESLKESRATTDKVAQKYSDQAKKTSYLKKVGFAHARFINYLQVPAKILDLGAGSGADMVKLQQRGYAVRTADLPATTNDLTLPDNKVDGVWMASALTTISPQDALETLSEVVRVLRPGGIIYLSVDEHYTLRDTANVLAQAGLQLVERWEFDDGAVVSLHHIARKPA